jgi:enoyl-CoA hydratase/carnithine racemase
MSVSTGNNFVEVDFSIQKIAIVKINRPEAKNALNTEVRKQLAQAFTELSFNDEINAIVLTGGEEVFAAGADLKEMATATSTEMLLRHTERYWNAIAQCPKPVIAAVNGYALGGGCELAMHATLLLQVKAQLLVNLKLKSV